jgi:hypothetical protein
MSVTDPWHGEGKTWPCDEPAPPSTSALSRPRPAGAGTVWWASRPQGTPDDFLHDLGRAAVDGHDPRVAPGGRDGVLVHGAVAPVELHAAVHDPLGQLGAPPLRHGGPGNPLPSIAAGYAGRLAHAGSLPNGEYPVRGRASVRRPIPSSFRLYREEQRQRLLAEELSLLSRAGSKWSSKGSSAMSGCCASLRLHGVAAEGTEVEVGPSGGDGAGATLEVSAPSRRV